METKTQSGQAVAIRIITNQEQSWHEEGSTGCIKRQVSVRNSTKDVFCSVFRDLRAGRVS